MPAGGSSDSWCPAGPYKRLLTADAWCGCIGLIVAAHGCVGKLPNDGNEKFVKAIIVFELISTGCSIVETLGLSVYLFSIMKTVLIALL